MTEVPFQFVMCKKYAVNMWFSGNNIFCIGLYIFKRWAQKGKFDWQTERGRFLETAAILKIE